MPTATASELLQLGRPEVACLFMGRLRLTIPGNEVWQAYLLGRDTLGRLQAALGGDEVEHLLDEGARLTIPTLVERALAAIDEIERLVE